MWCITRFLMSPLRSARPGNSMTRDRRRNNKVPAELAGFSHLIKVSISKICCQKLSVSCWGDTFRWYVVLVLVVVLDPIGSGPHQLYFFDYENEDDDDEKQSYLHFRDLPLTSLLSNCPAGAAFLEGSLGKSLVSYQSNGLNTKARMPIAMAFL